MMESALFFFTLVDKGVTPTGLPSMRTVAPSGSLVIVKTWSVPLKTVAQPVNNMRVDAKLMVMIDFKGDFIGNPFINELYSRIYSKPI